jgi:mannose-1-phosphate guanylyltransferase
MSQSAQSLPEAERKNLNPKVPALTWTIILIREERVYLSSLARGSYMDWRPKQFASLNGIRSMFQHTCNRALRHSAHEKILVILAENQKCWAFPQMPEIPTRNFIIQPRNLDTGPAICLAVAHIMEEDPQASILLFPTDHFIYPEERLVEIIERVLPALDVMTGMSAALLAIRPTEPRKNMNWILPGKPVGNGNLPGFFKVQQFIEKPHPQIVRKLYEDGALLNTSILAAKARRLWYLLWKRMPETSSLIARRHRELTQDGSKKPLEEAFVLAGPFDLFSHVLKKEPGELVVTAMDEIT